jgi:hypothetical protein
MAWKKDREYIYSVQPNPKTKENEEIFCKR